MPVIPTASQALAIGRRCRGSQHAGWPRPEGQEPGGSRSRIAAEAQVPNRYSPALLAWLTDNGFPHGAIVEGVVQRQFNIEETMDTMGNMGMEWTRLVKDRQSADGWKQLIPLDGDWNNHN
ncbi:MAG TPA: hypothetical protein VFM05_02560 [Candidatus Saccharimonadales bacterium]|nr:hypothetical protein [Candidatus Saccharimonadales bacterium]